MKTIFLEYELLNERNQNLSLTEQIFVNRGIDIKNIKHYLNTKDSDILSPSLLSNIKDGARMLIKHISNNDNILIIVDSDADGYTSAALLINYLYTLFPAYTLNHIQYKIHSGKQHGIDLENVDINNIKLIICPDSSSNEFDKHKELSSQNINILILDHHEADHVSEYACVINNQLCDYPTKSLCGVGVVYKFCCYLDELCNLDVPTAEKFLDLVALGEISDIMDLRDFETRHLISKGLANITNPFFYYMVQKQDYSLSKAGGLIPFGVAFYITPQINATIRVGSLEEKDLLFQSMLIYRAYEKIPSTKRGCKGQFETIVEQACRNCTNLKNKQTKEQDSSLEIIQNIIQKNELFNNKILVVVLPEEAKCNTNLTGLIANKLMGEYQRPVLLLNQKIHEDGSLWYEGSGRGYSKSKLNNFKDFLTEQGIYDCGGYAEGHQGAFGFGIPAEQFDFFINKCYNKIKDLNFNTFYKVDFIFKDEKLEDCDIQEILQLGMLYPYWGTGLEEPLVAFEKIPVIGENIKLMSPDKNPTLKIILPNGLNCIKFKSSEEEFNELFSEFGRTFISLVGKIKINEWNGSYNPQILIEDYEIIRKEDYYF